MMKLFNFQLYLYLCLSCWQLSVLLLKSFLIKKKIYLLFRNYYNNSIVVVQCVPLLYSGINYIRKTEYYFLK